MKPGDIVRFKNDFEFEAFDDNDDPIGMRILPKGTQATVERAFPVAYAEVEVSFSGAVWQANWGTNENLWIAEDELEQGDVQK